MLARLWANQVIEGNKGIDEVPPKLWDAVERLLTEDGHPELIYSD